MPKSEIPKPRSGNDKYGLYALAAGKKKDFPLDRMSKEKALRLYNVLRLSAWYYGQKHERTYVTRKMETADKKAIVRVYRET